MQFGQMLKSYRISRGMRNRAKFARDLGVSPEAMRLIEVGKSLPRVDTLRAMLDFLDLEKWERSKMTMRWFEERVRLVGKDLPDDVPRSFIELFGTQFFDHVVAAVEEEIGEEEGRELGVSLVQTATVILDDLLGMSDLGDTEEG